MTVPVSRLMKNEAASEREKANAGIFDIYQSVEPISGTAGHGVGVCGEGSRYFDVNRKTTYVQTNGTITSPYWVPQDIITHPSFMGYFHDFRDFVGEPLADTDAVLIVPGSGLRIFGQGLAETDSGLVVVTGAAGPYAEVTTTDEAEHLVALSFGTRTGDALWFQPDSQGVMAIEALVSMKTAITLRNFFIGWIGTAVDALDPPATGLTTTITLIQDDLAGLFYDARLTAASTLCAIHNKSDEAADTTVAATTTGEVFPAAGVAVRLRVEIDRAGTMYCFKDRALIATVASALDVDEEVAPVLLVGSTSSAIKVMNVNWVKVWGRRI
jgi:hypothetical protein